MPIVTVRIRNVNYPIVCDNGQEELLQTLAQTLNARVDSLAGTQGKGSDIRLLVMAALMMESEIIDLKENNQDISSNSPAHLTTLEPASNSPSCDPAIGAELDNIKNRLENIASELDQV